MADDLQLNSLERFRKHSQKLILEEHGHCEVPAGCGGVVLRWRNPDEGIPVFFLGAFPARSRIYVDGTEIESARTTLQPGDHFLAVELTQIDDNDRLFVWSTQLDSPDFQRRDIIIPGASTSSADGWTCMSSTAANQPDWFLPDTPADDWSPMQVVSNVDTESLGDRMRYSGINRMLQTLVALQIPPDTQTLLIRKPFTLEDQYGQDD